MEKIAESLVGVHTHTHTHTISLKKKIIKYVNSKVSL